MNKKRILHNNSCFRIGQHEFHEHPNAKDIANLLGILLYNRSRVRSYNRPWAKAHTRFHKTTLRIPKEKFINRISERPVQKKMQRKIIKEGRKLDILISFGDEIISVAHDEDT